MDQSYLKHFSGPKPPASRLWLVVLLVIFFLGMAGACFMLFSSRQALARRFTHMKQMLSQAESTAQQYRKEKETVIAEKEKLQADTLSYMTLNNDLQKEKDVLLAKLKGVDALITANKEEIVKVKSTMKDQRKRLLDQREKERRALNIQKQGLILEVKKHERAIQQERSLYHYDLGVAYSKAGLMRDAVREYEASLKSDNANADAHYNLALLYKSVENNQARAVQHFRKYLELKPGADDAAWVRGILDRMEEPVDSDQDKDSSDESMDNLLGKADGYDQVQ